MEIKNNFDNLNRELKEYANLKSISLRLHLVELLSEASSAVFSHLIVGVLLSLSLLFLLLALMLVFSHFLGLIYSLLVVGMIPALVAFFIYLGRNSLFADMFVVHFCKMFFSNNHRNEVSRDE